MHTKEHQRLQEAEQRSWRFWGPYLSERQWGTVREDYSGNGDAWNYFTHDQARSRAYHWGEDGLGGICDVHGVLCFALALWNGKDPILKERVFGLANSEGNHVEDAKEYYFYLDSTPTHSQQRRPAHGTATRFQEDPHWRDLMLFYEYFHGDNGAGIGASHQTGWSGLVARFIQLNASLTAEMPLTAGTGAIALKKKPPAPPVVVSRQTAVKQTSVRCPLPTAD